MSMAPAIVWFRQDLRVSDQPALHAAVQSGRPLLLAWIQDEAAHERWPPGAAGRWWLHHSLRALGAHLDQIAGASGTLLLLQGAAEEVLARLAASSGATALYFNRCFEPGLRRQEARVLERLRAVGVEVHAAAGAVLARPEDFRNASGGPYRVFTPFWNALARTRIAPPLPAPRRLEIASLRPDEGRALADLGLLPRIDWAAGMRSTWQPGEAGAARRLAEFLAQAFTDYRTQRDRPDLPGTSRLSPHLHWGEIGVRELWHAVSSHAGGDAELLGHGYLREIAWREFSIHLLHHFADLPERPLRPEFAAFPWKRDAAQLAAWQQGRTGYPLVDAGMRELWHTGWMHNRVRMIVASFLVKDLLQPWTDGEAWFWDTLVDADLANNAASWQWVAGCGADAAPFFRIFNPVTQSKRFDPQGAYLRRWVPELAQLPDAHLHAPWEAPGLVLEAAGVRLGRDYPLPMVAHDVARKRALAAFQALAPAQPARRT